MTKKLKVMTVVGTRPELIKLSEVIKKLDRFTDHIFVHTGQNYDYELNRIFFEDLGIRQPDYFLEAAGSPAETIASVLVKVDELLFKHSPDAFLIYGDTNSCLSVISAKRRKVPIFHLESGNRCFDVRVPEEINRKIVDHTSDINMVHSSHAKEYLVSEGFDRSMIFVSGSPLFEIYETHRESIAQSKVLKKLDLKDKKYFVLSMHREENVDSKESLGELIDTINGLCEKYDMPVVFSVHPRTRKKLDELASHKLHSMVRQLKPLSFSDYVALQEKSYCVLSDSGSLTEEASMRGFPAVMIRKSHERPEGMDGYGTVLMAPISVDGVLDAVHMATHIDAQMPNVGRVKEYENPFYSSMVVRVIRSYTDYINREVWKKSL
ncbi:MAG: UDP-N-acetylglucosamine 2-epimerase (non-hydrolyzing) [Bdellovibrionota bacterium]